MMQNMTWWFTVPVYYLMHPCSFSNGGTINLILTLTLLTLQYLA